MELQKIRKVWSECQVCGEEYTDSRILPCGHSFCFYCIKQMKNTSNVCKICKIEFSVSTKQLSPNFAVNYWLNISPMINNNEKEQKRTKKCEECEEATAENYCENCGLFFCNECSNKLHKNFKTMKNHKIINEKNEMIQKNNFFFHFSRCSNHFNEDEKFFCEQCKKFLCIYCSEEHRSRSHIPIITFLYFTKSTKNLWKFRIEKIVSNFNQSNDHFTEKLKQKMANFSEEIFSLEEKIAQLKLKKEKNEKKLNLHLNFLDHFHATNLFLNQFIDQIADPIIISSAINEYDQQNGSKEGSIFPFFEEKNLKKIYSLFIPSSNDQNNYNNNDDQNRSFNKSPIRSDDHNDHNNNNKLNDKLKPKEKISIIKNNKKNFIENNKNKINKINKINNIVNNPLKKNSNDKNNENNNKNHENDKKISSSSGSSLLSSLLSPFNSPVDRSLYKTSDNKNNNNNNKDDHNKEGSEDEDRLEEGSGSENGSESRSSSSSSSPLFLSIDIVNENKKKKEKKIDENKKEIKNEIKIIKKMINRSGEMEGKLKQPNYTAIRSENNLFAVTDGGNDRVVFFDLENGNFLFQIGEKKQSKEEGHFHSPRGVYITPKANLIAICDRDNHRVQLFDLNGHFKHSFGKKGKEEGEFYYPHGISISYSGKLIAVSDCYNKRIQFFDLNGNFQRKIECGFKPISIDLSNKEKLIVISDKNNKIHVFDWDGKKKFLIGGEEEKDIREGSGEDGKFDNPSQVSIKAKAKMIAVADLANDRIQFFDLSGKFRCKVGGERGDDFDQFNQPYGIALDKKKNLIVVSEVGNDRLKLFSSPPPFLP